VVLRCSVLVGFHPVSETEGLHPDIQDKPRNPEVLNVEKSRTKFDIIDRVCGKKVFLGVGVSSRSFQALLPSFFVPSYVLQEG
jgi:hypothetical protein